MPAHHFHLLADEALDVPQEAALFLGAERDRDAIRPRTGGAADAVNIALRNVR